MEVEVRLLGGVDVEVDGRAVDVGPAKRRALLAALALSAGTAVPVPRLVALVWGDRPPRSATKTLQSHVARLRGVLGPDTIEREGDAYRLDVPRSSVDALRFEDRLTAGDAAAALAEWRGAPLAGIEAPGLDAVVDRLTEQHLGATEAHLATTVDLDPSAAAARLAELTARHPLREELWALRMTALARAGRRAEALDAFHEARRLLRDELGIDPGRRLRSAQATILADEGAAPAVATATPTSASTTAAPGPPDRPGGLPARPPPLIGRERARADVVAALDRSPLVCLVGPGGIGKTRLALAAAVTAATSFDGDACLVELAGVAAPTDVARAVADALGIPDSVHRSTTGAIAAAVSGSPLLLVIDNCEHVVDAVADLVSTLVQACPHLTVLATSRRRLGVDGEVVVEVAPLPAADGAALFAARARTASRVAGDDRDVERLCRRLDGLPLAIELAAARADVLSPRQLLGRLDDALTLLGGGRRDDVAHHRTLDATIRWSADLLDDDDRLLLARLSCFAGTFDLAAAETVAAGGPIDASDVVASLARLVDHSLVVATLHPDDERRFRLLETIRAFAREELTDPAARTALADRHAAWATAETHRIGVLLAGPDEVRGVERLASLWPDLRLAIARTIAAGDAGRLGSLVRPIVGEIVLRSSVELGEAVEHLLDLLEPSDEQGVAEALGWAAQRYAVARDPGGFDDLAARHGPPDHLLVAHARAFAHADHAALLDLAPRAVAELHEGGQHHLAELTEPDLAVALLNVGRHEEAEQHAASLVARYTAQGPPSLLNWALMIQGFAALFGGSSDRADALFGRAVDVAVPPRTHSPNRVVVARVEHRRGRTGRALALLTEQVDELLATSNMQGASLVALELIGIVRDTGRHEDAAELLGYLDAAGLLEAPGFAELARDPHGAPTSDELAGRRAAGALLDDERALRRMQALLEDLARTG